MADDEVARVRAHYAAEEAHYASRFSLDRRDVRWAWARLCDELGVEIDRALDAAGVGLARARILDLGCGAGRALGWLADRGAPASRLLGVDLVAERLGAARAAVAAPLALADGARLPCQDGAFDLALALTAFSSMPGGTMRRAAAAELLRVVRREGAVICYEFARKNPANRRTVALDEPALHALFPGAIVRCRRVTLHPALRRLLAPFGDGALGALERVGALRSHVLAVISRR